MHQVAKCCLREGTTSSEMATAFEVQAGKVVNEQFPLKKATVTQGELRYFNEELKALRRQRIRVYNKEGKSAKYHELKTKFQAKLKCEAIKYKDLQYNAINNLSLLAPSCQM